jgi:hypothetical protein
MPKSNRVCVPASSTDCPRPVQESTAALVCHCCGDVMIHDRTVPRAGVRPETLVFVCPSCKEITAARRVA